MKSATSAVFIRASGERTERACLHAIEAQGVDPDRIEFIRETPFSKALSVGYSRAIEKGAEWSFFIDADIILRPNSMQALERFAGQQDERVFCFQGYFLDKFTVSLRDGGVHAYRTRFLDRALALVGQGGEVIRPESFVKRGLMKQGLHWKQFAYVIGIHDFGQNNFDIFRKGYVHAQKHFHLLPDLLPKLKRRELQDDDYALMIEGIAEGLRARSDARIDTRYPPFAERFATLGVDEKPALLSGELSPEMVEQILESQARDADLSVRGLPFTAREAIRLDGTERLGRGRRLWLLWRRKRLTHGAVGAIIYGIGQVFENAGSRLKKMAGNASRRASS